MSSEKASNSPGLCPVKGQKLSLGTQTGSPKLVLEPVFGVRWLAYNIVTSGLSSGKVTDQQKIGRDMFRSSFIERGQGTFAVLRPSLASHVSVCGISFLTSLYSGAPARVKRYVLSVM